MSALTATAAAPPTRILGRRLRWLARARPDLDTMDRANQEIREALARGSRRRLSRSRNRVCLRAIDDCLMDLEELHAKGTQISRRDGCRKVLDGLQQKIDLALPLAVQEARNSYDLHCALLNWQSTVLDALVPHRRELFPDLNQERDEWPRPRRRRRRRLAAPVQPGLAAA
ncbi:MAG: hypothetical protein ACREOL_09260 [Candidatus Dormibacteria bacterium]